MHTQTGVTRDTGKHIDQGWGPGLKERDNIHGTVSVRIGQKREGIAVALKDRRGVSDLQWDAMHPKESTRSLVPSFYFLSSERKVNTDRKVLHASTCHSITQELRGSVSVPRE